MSNEILSFCETDIGTNLLTQGEYAADADRTSGNKPGVASSKLVNKALRQSAFVASSLAELISLTRGVDVLDNAVSARMVSQLASIITPLKYIETGYTTPGASGTHNLSYVFFCASANATSGATYTNNAVPSR